MRLRNKVAIVTGASRGIGKAISLAFAQEGADVVVAARTETENPQLPGTIYKTAEEVQQLGRRSLAMRTDVSDEQSVTEMVQNTLKEFGRVDILVNNAAVAYYAPLAEMPVKRWELVMRVNILGTFLCSRAVLPGMIERKSGYIINLSSTVARSNEGLWTGIPYIVSKAAIERLTIALAEEVKEHNIAVNALCPHFTATEGMKFWNPKMDMSDWQRPEMWGKFAAFLAAQDARTLTGKALAAEELREEVARLKWAL